MISHKNWTVLYSIQGSYNNAPRDTLKDKGKQMQEAGGEGVLW